MKGRTKTKADERLHDDLRSMGCAVCLLITKPEVDELEPCAIHHIDGKTKPNAHSLVLPLCPTHHQYGTKQHPSIHASGSAGGKAAFKRAYGVDEYELLELCEQHLDRPYSSEN